MWKHDFDRAILCVFMGLLAGVFHGILWYGGYVFP